MVQSIILWYLSRSIFIQCQFFYVLFYSHCLLGFAKYNEKCECDHALKLVEVFTCNINERTILRPANSWITASTNNYSHNYTVSQNCPFDYCLPHPSHLHLSYPNSQCQFNRSGLLCGQCQQGLSTVFGSSQCRTNTLTEIMMPSCICCHDKTLRDEKHKVCNMQGLPNRAGLFE